MSGWGKEARGRGKGRENHLSFIIILDCVLWETSSVVIHRSRLIGELVGEKGYRSLVFFFKGIFFFLFP